ncbi:hypothetical protein [Micromonospora sp. KC213]|uniref:hypothetical protein n=1 Tax=Micromonospora sp. KC213 TaxID=2530378 RepID=UPI00104C53E3|nr:hypothetical protein [Micromonospora sp. KC213]TDC43606.1 hypothetical protein E1166_03175 [Micromonospora sp. KC213]
MERRAIVSAIGAWTAFAATASLLGAPPTGAHAVPPITPASVVTPPASEARALAESEVTPAERAEALGEDWQKSTDIAWTTAGDDTGFHLLMAPAASGYAWRTVATLREAGIETDRWIGNVCLTESGRKAVVVYAPRSFTNRDQLFDRGAFTAVVDTTTGAVTKLPVRGSIAYFDPGCGAGERAVITQARGEVDPSGAPPATRLIAIDASTGEVVRSHELPGQVTSAVPAPADRIVAANGASLVSIDTRGRRRTLTRTSSVPFRLTIDGEGGLVYLDPGTRTSTLRRLAHTAAAGRPVTLASGPVDRLDLRPGTGLRAFVLGEANVTGRLPAGAKRLEVPATSEPSTGGGLAILHSSRPKPSAGTDPLPKAYVDAMTNPHASASGTPDTLTLSTRVLTTGRQASFTVQPGVRPAPLLSDGSAPHPLNAAPAANAQRTRAASTSSPTDPVDTDAWCSVARNDARTQTYQPTARQVEWAADQAVVGNLNLVRPLNWKGSGLPSYQPQKLFPPLALTDGGRVPVQIFLGILAQESNLWQASGQVKSGSTGNSLIGNFYGRDTYNNDAGDDWVINFADSDCGYGLTQITDGMRKPAHPKPDEVILSTTQQRAAALDYTANIAGGLRILQSKWNLLKAKGMLPKDRFDPKWLESWFMPVWAYNSGLQPNAANGNTSGCDPGPTCTDAQGNWGLGWHNNPANPKYPPSRLFFNEDPHDAAHPQDWPYPEKVIGWAAYSISTVDGPGFRPAWWVTALDRRAAQPPRGFFCFPQENKCDINHSVTPDDPSVVGEPAGPCLSKNAAGKYDLHCWWHSSIANYRDCSSGYCGNELLRFDTTYPEQPDGTNDEPNCSTAGLPAGAKVIDNLADSVPSIRRLNDGSACTRPASAGTFGLIFNRDGAGMFRSKVDFHQRGVGFGGHIWYSFTHTPDGQGTPFGVTGKWTLSSAVNGPAQILVHVPNTGAQARVRYDIKTARGVRSRMVSQDSATNRWVSLGAFLFNAPPEVTLSNLIDGGTGDEPVAWDAIAVVPISGTYQEKTVDAVAYFDENQDINTTAPTSWADTPLASHQSLYDWAMQMSLPLTRMPVCTGSGNATCVTPKLRNAMQTWQNWVIASGTSATSHPAGSSVAAWINFANKYTQRPTTDSMPAHFQTDDASFKIRAQAQVSFVKTADGKIVQGSESVAYSHRTADTHLPDFVLETFRAINADYGVPLPDLSYRLPDLNTHDGVVRLAEPQKDGVLPGRAYSFAGKKPTVTDLNGNPTTDGNCVAALFTAGGSIGYRPALGTSVSANYRTWSSRVRGDSRVPPEVDVLVENIYNLFFKDGTTGSIFGQSPPIWQELNFRYCADGSLRKNSDRPILRASLMPSQYLYADGKAINADGAARTSAAPLWTGDFAAFSRVPDPNVDSPLWQNPYGPCGATTNKSGNPWDITALPPADPHVNPSRVHFCVDRNLTGDPDYSSQ